MSLLERILDSFSLFCYPMLPILCYQYVSISAEFLGFRGKKLKKAAKNSKKCRVLGPKTSDFLGTNLRTFDAKPPYFWQRSPMFPVFRPEMPQNPPVPDFAIFRTKAGCGGFRGPSQGVNDGVREAGGIRKTGVGKYCTLVRLLRIRGMVYGLGFHPSFSRHGND